MGEITEMILDGMLCQICGDYMGDPVGYPRTCIACDSEPKEADENDNKTRRSKSVLHSDKKRGYVAKGNIHADQEGAQNERNGP